MIIQKVQDKDKLTVKISGHIDTNTVPELEKEIQLNGIKMLILDFKEVDYISSAGLGALLLFQKQMDNQGGHLSIYNISPEVKEIFEMVCFLGLFDIQYP